MRKLNVLFLQSQTYFGADSMIHGLIMGALDRERVNVHVACNVGPDGKSAAFTALSRIPNLAILPTDFGPTLNERTRLEKVKGIVQVAPMLKSFASLVAYCRRHQIDIVHGTEKPRDAFYGLLLARAIG